MSSIYCPSLVYMLYFFDKASHFDKTMYFTKYCSNIEL